MRNTFKYDDEDEVKNRKAILPAFVKKTFDGSRISSRLRHLMLANRQGDKMNAMMNKIDISAIKPAILVGMLLYALKVEEHVACKTDIRANHERVMWILHRVGDHITPKS